MKKLRLDVEEIQVNGFDVLPSDEPVGGTVLGREGKGGAALFFTENTRCEQYTCWNGSCGTGNPCRLCP